MKGWGFTYKTNIVWYKVRKDGGPDGRGVGFYFRNVTELVLFGIKGQYTNTRARAEPSQCDRHAEAGTLQKARSALRYHPAV